MTEEKQRQQQVAANTTLEGIAILALGSAVTLAQAGEVVSAIITGVVGLGTLIIKYAFRKTL